MSQENKIDPPNILRFLLVEDDDDHAQIIKRGLRKTQDLQLVEIEHVNDGFEALAFLRKEREYSEKFTPDIVLLDLKLPKMDGHDVLIAIKSDITLRDILVVILTTSDADSDMTKAYLHHVNSYLVKPLDGLTFRKMVEDLRLYWGTWNRSPRRSRLETENLKSQQI